MSGEITHATSFVEAMAVRFKNTWYGHLKAVLDTILPVQRVGHPMFSDIERPSWGISILCPWNAVAGYPSCGITSRYDIAIESFEFQVFSAAGTPLSSTVLVFTPPANYNPFALDAFIWFPWIRPARKYSSSNTLGISGRSAGSSPYVGWQLFCNLITNYSMKDWINLDPPLILPAGYIFCVQCPVANSYTLLLNLRYREIG